MKSQSLRLISGTVSNLSTYSSEEEFTRGAGQQAVGVAVAAGLAAAGLAGAAAGASIAATSAGDSVEFFTCQLGDQTVSGRFSKVTFNDGDELQMVQADEWPNDLILAARRKSDRTLWVVPHCSRGIAGHRAAALRMFLWGLVLGPAFVLSGYLIFGVWLGSDALDFSSLLFPLTLSVAMGLIAAIYFPIRFYLQWLPVARRAESLFSTLGYASPSEVDLERDHKLYCKAQGIKWPYESDGPWIYHYMESR